MSTALADALWHAALLLIAIAVVSSPLWGATMFVLAWKRRRRRRAGGRR